MDTKSFLLGLVAISSFCLLTSSQLNADVGKQCGRLSLHQQIGEDLSEDFADLNYDTEGLACRILKAFDGRLLKNPPKNAEQLNRLTQSAIQYFVRQNGDHYPEDNQFFSQYLKKWQKLYTRYNRVSAKSGATPDMTVNPISGATPDMQTNPLDGATPDMHVNPFDGATPDMHTNPLGGATPDM